MSRLVNYAAISLLLSFALVVEVQSHGMMKYPPTRQSAGPNDDFANRTPIFGNSAIGGVLPGGQKLYKHFPCGSNTTSQITALTPGETVNVILDTSNNHDGGDCQFGLAFKNDSAYVVFHTIFDTCLKNVRGQQTYPVKLPDKLPGGPAIFCWAWIPVNEYQYYHSCADVVFPGERNGTLTGKALVVVDIDDSVKAKSNGENGDLVHNAPVITVEVDGNNVKVTPPEFSPSKPLKVNDPLLKYFKSGGKTVSAKDSESAPDPAGVAPNPVVGTSNPKSNSNSNTNANMNTNSAGVTPNGPTSGGSGIGSSPAPISNGFPGPTSGSSWGSSPSGFSRPPLSSSPTSGSSWLSKPISGPSLHNGNAPVGGWSSSASTSLSRNSPSLAPFSSSSTINPYTSASHGNSPKWS